MYHTCATWMAHMRCNIHVPHKYHKYTTLVSHMYHTCTMRLAHFRCQMNDLHECHICTTHASCDGQIWTTHVPKEWHINGTYNMAQECSALVAYIYQKYAIWSIWMTQVYHTCTVWCYIWNAHKCSTWVSDIYPTCATWVPCWVQMICSSGLTS